MTTPFDERLEEILTDLVECSVDSTRYGYSKAYVLAEDAKQAIRSLFREMVEEAKPEPKDQVGQIPFDDESRCRFYRYGGYNFAIDQYEANLLQQLGEK